MLSSTYQAINKRVTLLLVLFLVIALGLPRLALDDAKHRVDIPLLPRISASYLFFYHNFYISRKLCRRAVIQNTTLFDDMADEQDPAVYRDFLVWENGTRDELIYHVPDVSINTGSFVVSTTTSGHLQVDSMSLSGPGQVYNNPPAAPPYSSMTRPARVKTARSPSGKFRTGEETAKIEALQLPYPATGSDLTTRRK